MKNVWIIIKYIQVHSFRVKLMNRAGQGSGYTDPLYYILSLPLLGNLNNPPPQKKKYIYIYIKRPVLPLFLTMNYLASL